MAVRLGRAAQETLDPTVPARPRLADDVQVHEPADEGAPWIIQRGYGRYLRVGADMAKLGRALDGRRDHAELVAALGPPWTKDALGFALGQLKRMGLLDDGNRAARGVPWVKYVPPLTVQFTLLRPARLLAWCAPLLSLLATRFWAVVAAAVSVAGVVSLVVLGPAVVDTLSGPLPLAVYAGVACATYLVMVLHEFGHGAVLTYYGGRPGRMGVMLLYLLPAFFCDVSDGWRLPRKQQRVRVALAGIGTQFVLAGTVAVAALLAGDSAVRDGMLVFSVLNYLAGLLNLLPFVKLDGYLALMSHLDVSNLRGRAMTDARRFLARLLFGGTYESELPQWRWAVPFGLGCLVFPIYLVGWVALSLWGDLFRGLGLIGAMALAFVVVILLGRLGMGLLRRVHEARAAGAPLWRIGTGFLVVAAALTALMVLVEVPYSVAGGYRYRAGQLELVLPPSADRDVVRKGATVRLLRNGVVFRGQVGSAVVAADRAAKASAPVSVLFPVRTDRELPVTVAGYPLSARTIPAERSGAARVDAGRRPLGEWLFATYISAAWPADDPGE